MCAVVVIACWKLRNVFSVFDGGFDCATVWSKVAERNCLDLYTFPFKVVPLFACTEDEVNVAVGFVCVDTKCS